MIDNDAQRWRVGNLVTPLAPRHHVPRVWVGGHHLQTWAGGWSLLEGRGEKVAFVELSPHATRLLVRGRRNQGFPTPQLITLRPESSWREGASEWKLGQGQGMDAQWRQGQGRGLRGCSAYRLAWPWKPVRFNNDVRVHRTDYDQGTVWPNGQGPNLHNGWKLRGSGLTGAGCRETTCRQLPHGNSHFSRGPASNGDTTL